MKILYITTIGETMRFFPSLIKSLIESGNIVDIACNEVDRIPDCYKALGCKIYPISCFRSPLKKGNLDAIKQIEKIVDENNYDIVHCHTPIAAACTRLACRKARKRGTKVFYTAHGFHFYKGAPLKNWLIYYPIEKLCAHFTDVLITINNEDYALAKKKLKAKKVAYVPGVGIDLDKFGKLTINKAKKREELGVPVDATILLSVGELNKNKNHQVIIRAMSKINIPKLHYLIAGIGDKRDALEKLAKELGLEHNVHFLGYRNDINELCKVSDIFCFPSYREGLSVALMEAMACGCPVACSKIRGNTDLIDEKGGVLFNPHSAEDCRRSIETLLCSDLTAISRYNTEKIKKFALESVKYNMKELYSKYYED